MSTAIASAPQRVLWTKKYLVLWSGGLDSTWSLYTLLKKTRAEIYVHHVHKRSRVDDPGGGVSFGYRYEFEAVRAMLPWFKENCRPFAYSESVVDLTAFSAFARDMSTSLFMGAQAAMTWGFSPSDVIVTGLNGSEDEGNATDPTNLYRGTFRRMLNRSMLQAVMQRSETPEVISLMPAPTREQQLTDLPPELAALTASCRAPVEKPDGSLANCGSCKSCLAIGAARGALEPVSPLT